MLTNDRFKNNLIELLCSIQRQDYLYRYAPRLDDQKLEMENCAIWQPFQPVPLMEGTARLPPITLSTGAWQGVGKPAPSTLFTFRRILKRFNPLGVLLMARADNLFVTVAH